MNFEHALAKTPEEMRGVSVEIQEFPETLLLVPHIKSPHTHAERRREAPRMDDILAPARPFANFRELESTLSPENFDPETLARYSGDNDLVSLINTERGLFLPRDLPEAFLPVIAKAYAREVATNPSYSTYNANLVIRMEDVATMHREARKLGAHKPHLDYESSKEAHFYFLSSPPSTIQYTGIVRDHEALKKEFRATRSAADWLRSTQAVDGAAASSLLPWQLYRAEDGFLHTSPWEQGGEVQPASEAPPLRLLFRLAFIKP